jgi:NADPH:quinone reductase-like Zn-dependent oxidoreductase
VGTFAVQIAKALGAEVTAVCRAEKAAMVKSLGADQIIYYSDSDYSQAALPYALQNALRNDPRYDLMLDAAAYRPIRGSVAALKPGGTYVMVGGDTTRILQALALGPWLSLRTGRSVKCLTSTPNQADLQVLKTLIEAGKITPVIDRTYPLRDVPTAIRQLEARQVQGKIAIEI